jgi:MFS family permease
MLKKIYYRYLKKRHYWRVVGFDELSEIYATQLLRSLAISLVGIFVPVYLYKLGYSISDISILFICWSISRLFVWAYTSAKIVARFGPKHSMAIAVAIQIAYLSLILSIQSMNWPLWLIGIVGSLAYGLYLMAFEVDFSKIKHTEHGGKEIGYLQIFERTGAVLGPLIGGLIAGFFDPRYTIMIAIFVLCGSLIPLFLTDEPTRKHQKLRYKDFPFKRHRRDFLVSSAFVVENNISVTVWPLFLGAFILIANTYQALGLLVATSTIASFLTAYIIGKLIDNNKGKLLLNTGAIANAVIHLFRPFVGNIGQAFAINLVNEPVTSMYKMPFLKGKYDASDNVPGYRIVYYMITEMCSAIFNIFFWLTIYIISTNFNDKIALQITFAIGAIMSIMLILQKYQALK